MLFLFSIIFSIFRLKSVIHYKSSQHNGEKEQEKKKEIVSMEWAIDFAIANNGWLLSSVGFSSHLAGGRL